MIETKSARDLQEGDVLSTSGARIDQVVPCGHGKSVYIRAEFDDGYTQVVTISADTAVHVWTPDSTQTDR